YALPASGIDLLPAASARPAVATAQCRLPRSADRCCSAARPHRYPAAELAPRSADAMRSASPVHSGRGHGQTAAHRGDGAPAIPTATAPAPAHPPPPWITPADVATPA